METFLITHPTLTTLWFFILGTIIGSFLNVVILRHESDEKITGRSHCQKCKRTLMWHELIPIVSYVVQKGKCKGCAERISPQYPLVEFVTGTLFALVFLVNVVAVPVSYAPNYTLYLKLVLELCVWSLLVVITVYDIRTKLIPNVFSYSFSALSLVLLFITSYTQSVPAPYHLPPVTSLLAGPLLFLPFYLLWKFSDGKWMGLGDGKFALGIGWFLGLEYGGSAIILAFWFGAAVSLTLMVAQHIGAFLRRSYALRPTPYALDMKSEIPFGPFMVLGTLYVYIFGWSIMSFIY